MFGNPCGHGRCHGTEGVCSVIFSEPAEETVSDPLCTPGLTGVAALVAVTWCHYNYPRTFGRKNYKIIVTHLKIFLIIREFANQNVRGSREMTNEI